MRLGLLLMICLLSSAAAAPCAKGQAVPVTQPASTQPSLETSGVVERLLGQDATNVEGEVVARYDKAVLTREQLMDFLVQTRGLDALLNLMQLQIARALAEQEGITVTPDAIEQEKRETLRQAFAGVEEIREEQYGELLDQLLARQQLSRAEFDVVMATNAYLKALARPRIAAFLNDENLLRAFNARYGEQVRVRHIQLENLSQVAEVNKRLEAGEEFTKLVAEMSRNSETRDLGGLLPPFSMQTEIPEAFKEAAFGLEVGQVSQPVEAGGFYHLIKLDERIAPQAVKFENVKDDLKTQLTEEQSLVVVGQLRRALAQMLGSGNLQVSDPHLAQQLRERLAAIQPQGMTPEEMRRQLEEQRAVTRPATAPATRPATGQAD